MLARTIQSWSIMPTGYVPQTPQDCDDTDGIEKPWEYRAVAMNACDAQLTN